MEKRGGDVDYFFWDEGAGEIGFLFLGKFWIFVF